MDVITTMQLTNGIRYYKVLLGDGRHIRCRGLGFLRDAVVEEAPPVDLWPFIAHVRVEHRWRDYYLTAEAFRFYQEYPEGLEIIPGKCVPSTWTHRVSPSMWHQTNPGYQFSDPEWPKK